MCPEIVAEEGGLTAAEGRVGIGEIAAEDGATPNAPRKPGVTSWAFSCWDSPSPVMVNCRGAEAAMPSKTRRPGRATRRIGCPGCPS